MSSETITRNDLTAILNEVLPPTASEYKKLLWTNPNPGADFAAQTMGLNLSDYDEVEIVATFLGDIVNSYSVRCPVGAGSNLAYQMLNTATATNASTFINGVARDFSVSTSGITFGNGQMTYNGSAYTNWPSRAIPYKIYGIKYERVNPPQVEIADVVIENGASGNWTYRKWSSGKVEAWYFNAAITFTTNTNGFQESIPIIIRPVTTIRNIQLTGCGNGFVGDIHHAWINSTANVINATATTAGSYSVSIYICFEN